MEHDGLRTAETFTTDFRAHTQAWRLGPVRVQWTTCWRNWELVLHKGDCQSAVRDHDGLPLFRWPADVRDSMLGAAPVAALLQPGSPNRFGTSIRFADRVLLAFESPPGLDYC